MDLNDKETPQKYIFKDAEVICQYRNELDMDTVTTCVKFSNGKYAIYDTDYDYDKDPCVNPEDMDMGVKIEYPSDEYLLDSLDEVKLFLEEGAGYNDAAHGLLKALLKKRSIKRYTNGSVIVEAILWDGTEESLIGFIPKGRYHIYEKELPLDLFYGSPKEIDRYAIIVSGKDEFRYNLYKGDYLVKGNAGDYSVYDKNWFEYTYKPCK